MSKTIDNKVVSMEFDNSKFEKNVQTSMSTLDKLKKALNFDSASKGFQKIEAESGKVNMSGLSGAIENVKVKFSAMEIVAITALSNITNSAINAGKRLVASLSIDQITAGWSKFEQKSASVQTIINSTGKSINEVNEYLDKLMWFSDETSYSFSDMTSSLAQLTSAGGDIDKLIPMIEGIANATAFAGKGTAEFSRAIYNLNQSYSAGKLQYIDWKSIELAGIGSKQLKETFIETAKALGRLDSAGRTAKGTLVEIGNFGETLKDDWADTEVMEAAFGKFSELVGAAYEAVKAGEFDTASEAIEALAKDYDVLAVKAFKSAQEAKTFTEAIEATKDAVSSGWLKTFEIIFGNYEQAKVLWTDLANTMWDVFASGAENRNRTLEEAMGSKWPEFIKQVKDAGIATDDFESKLKELARAHGITIDELIEQEGSLQAVLDKGLISKEVVRETLSSFAKLKKGTGDLSKKLKEFQKICERVWNGEFGNGDERYQKLAEAGYNYAEVQELVNKTVNGYQLTLEDLNEEQLKSIGYTEEEIDKIKELADQANDAKTPIGKLIEAMEKPTGRALFVEALNKGLEAVVKSLEIVKNAWTEVFGTIESQDIYGIIERLNNSTGSTLQYIQNNAEKFKDSLKGLFAILDIIKMLVSDAILPIIKKVLRILGYGANDILTVTQSLGQLIVKFRDWLNAHRWLATVSRLISEYTVRFLGAIYKWIKSFFELPVVTKNLENLEKVVKDLSVSNVMAFIDNGADIVGKYISKLKELNKINLETVKASFAGLGKELSNYLSNINNLSPNLISAFKTLAADVSSGLQKLGDKFAWFKDKVSPIMDWIRDKMPKDFKISLGNILAIGIGAALIKLMNSLSKAFKKVDDIVGAFANIAGAISRFTESVNSVIKGLRDLETAYAKKLKSEAFLNIAKGITMIAAAIAALAILDSKKVLIAVAAVSTMMIAMTVLCKVMGNMKGNSDLGKAGIGMLAMAGAVLVLTMALKKFDKLKNPVVSVIGIIILLRALINVAQIASKFSKDLDQGIARIIPMAAAVLVLSIALKSLSKMNFGKIMTGLVGLAGCIGAMALLMLVCKNLKVSDVKPAITAAGALILLVIAFKAVAKMKPETIIMGLINMIGMLALLIPLFAITRRAGNAAIKCGGTIIAIGAALTLISVAMRIIAGLKAKELERATNAIRSIILSLGLVIAALSLMNNISGAGGNAHKAALTIASIGVALVAVAAAMLLLSVISKDKEKFDGALKAIVVIMGMFALIIASSGLAKDSYKTITGIAICIGVLAIALGALSMINNTEGLKSATKAIAIVMGTLALVISSTALAKNATKTIILLTVIIAALGGVLYMLASLPIGASIDAASAMGILLVSLSASMAILGYSKDISKTTLGKAAILAAIMVGMGALIGLLENLNVAPSIETAKSLSLLITSLSAALFLIGVAGLTGPALIAGMDAMLLLVAKLGILMAAIGGLDKIFDGGVSDIINRAVKILQAIGDGLGRFVGGFIGGIGIAATESMIIMGENLSKFMDKLGGFIEGCKAFTPEIATGAEAMAKTILTLTSAKLLNGLADFFSFGLFSRKSSSFEELGEGLKTFGKSMKVFSDSMDGVNTENIKYGCEALTAISDIASNLDSHNGIWQKITGDNKITDFINMLAECFTGDGENKSPFQKFADGLSSFSGRWKNIKNDTEEFCEVLEEVSKFAKTLETHGGFIKSCVTGDNKISDFVRMLSDCVYSKSGNGPFQLFADGLESISGSWDTIKINTDSYLEILGKISEFSNTLGKHGGISSLWSGDNKISSFIQSLYESLYYFSPFVSSLNQIASEINLQKAIDNSAFMVELLKKFSEISEAIPTNYSDLFTGNPISKISRDLLGASYSLKTFITNMSGVSGENLSDIGSGIANLIISVSSVASENNDALSTFCSNLLKLGNEAIASFIKSLADGQIELDKSGKALAQACLDGVASKHNDIVLSAQTMANTFTKSVTTPDEETGFNPYRVMKQAGMYLVDGLIEGIRAKTAEAIAAAQELASAVNAALQTGLGERSPSKITHKFGEYYDQGLANGINDSTGVVIHSVNSLADTAVSKFQSIISRISDAVNGDIDMNPVIRPVLDLSNIKSGASSINAMFSQNQAMAIMKGAYQNNSLEDQNRLPTAGVSYQFTQNNYSPKALSRVEIYRQTKNQFSALKGLVNA